jgi:Na+/proline symporter
MLAAAMSTLSSSLNSSANAAVSDFYRPIRTGRSEEHYLLVARGFTIFFGIAQIGVAIATVSFLSTQRSIITHVLSVAGFTTGILLGLFVLGGRAKRVSTASALVGMVVGVVAVTAAWLPSTWGQPIVAWPWFAPIGALTTIAVATVCDLVIRKSDSNSSNGLIPPST